MKNKILVIAISVLAVLAFFEVKNRYTLKASTDSQFIIINWRMTPSYVTDLNHPILFTFHLKDKMNLPIIDAKVFVEVNMNHAGMIPISREARHDQNGFYSTKLKLTMMGDWFLFLTIKKSNGEVIKKELPFSTISK